MMNLGAIRVRWILPLFVLLMFTDPLIGQSATTGWPDAIAPLTQQRSKAEICVALLKRYGKGPDIAKGQLVYGKAKSESDAVIAGLIAALATGGTPTSLSVLQTASANSVSGLAEFCNSVSDIVSTAATPGERDVWSAIAKIVGIEPLIRAISDGIAALYNNHRSDNLLTRKTIQTQLEAARWPEFAKVDPAQ